MATENQTAVALKIAEKAIALIRESSNGIDIEKLDRFERMLLSETAMDTLLSEDENAASELLLSTFPECTEDAAYHLKLATMNCVERFGVSEYDAAAIDDEILQYSAEAFAEPLLSIFSVLGWVSVHAGLKQSLKRITNDLKQYCLHINSEYLLSFVAIANTSQGKVYGSNQLYRPTMAALNGQKKNKAFSCLQQAVDTILEKSGTLVTHIYGSSRQSDNRIGVLSAKSIDTTFLIVNNQYYSAPVAYSRNEYIEYHFVERINSNDEYFMAFADEYEAEHAQIAECIREYGHLNSNIQIILLGDISSEYEEPEATYSQYMSDLMHIIEASNALKTKKPPKSIKLDVYSEYFGSLVDNPATVASFKSNIDETVRALTITEGDFGTIIDSNIDALISSFSYASNNFVGTLYDNDFIQEEMRNMKLRPQLYANKQFISYADPRLTDLFASIKDKVNRNIGILKEPALAHTLFTSEWLFANIGGITGFDNTFICAGYFKLVEQLLSTILLQDYANEYINTPKGERMICEKNAKDLMLEVMIRYISSETVMPKSQLAIVIPALSEWKDHIRNGYFHKHTLDAEDVLTIRNKTLEVIYMILGTVPRN